MNVRMNVASNRFVRALLDDTRVLPKVLADLGSAAERSAAKDVDGARSLTKAAADSVGKLAGYEQLEIRGSHYLSGESWFTVVDRSQLSAVLGRYATQASDSGDSALADALRGVQRPLDAIVPSRWTSPNAGRAAEFRTPALRPTPSVANVGQLLDGVAHLRSVLPDGVDAVPAPKHAIGIEHLMPERYPAGSIDRLKLIRRDWDPNDLLYAL